MSTLYHLRRVSDGAYWRPEGQGYTDKVTEAGRFMALYAKEAIEGTHGEHEMREIKEDGGFILASNLESALYLAIGALAEAEAHFGNGFKSIKRAAYEQNLTYLRKYRTIEVR